MWRGPERRVPSRSMKTRRMTLPVPTSCASPRATWSRCWRMAWRAFCSSPERMARRMASCCCCRAISATRLLVVRGEDRGHVVVQQVDRLLDDALKQRIVRRLGDGQVEGHIFLGGDHVARGGEREGHAVQVLERRAAGGQSRGLDLHRAADLHELDDALGALAHQRRQRLREARRGKAGDRRALSSAAGVEQTLGSSAPAGPPAPPGRPTPSMVARSRSAGMRSPGLNSPDVMSSRSWAAT